MVLLLRPTEPEELRRALERATNWLAELGLKPEGGRFGEYARIINLLACRGESPRQVGRRRVLFTIRELLSLTIIHSAFGEADPPETIRAKLHHYVRGPAFPAQERQGTGGPLARNTGFEILFGALMRRTGYRVSFGGEGAHDLLATHPDAAWLVECKRSRSGARIRANVEKAAGQLALALPGLRHDPKPRPLIALSVSGVLNPRGELLVPDELSVRGRRFRQNTAREQLVGVKKAVDKTLRDVPGFPPVLCYALIPRAEGTLQLLIEALTADADAQALAGELLIAARRASHGPFEAFE